ncbi:MAG: T9SS type A sorting domain-containing protein [Chitinophagaceae bacterium]|nr:T9SS type A sorting domain-containing protein [Chitinophagaceae bacterium]
MTVTSAGTATATDISNVRIFRDNDGNGAINGADAAVTGPAAQAYAASMVFAGITSETGLSVATYYLVVADVAGIGVSTPGNTTTVSSNTFTTTATTNTGSFTGNSRIIAAPPGTSTITAGPGAEPATISSLINTQGASVLNFDFIITDDGATPATDASAFQISQIVLNAGTGNAVTNWATAIAGVELSDGTNSTTVATIGASSITFTGILNGVGQLGYIADDANKTYTLKIWLNTNQGALSTVIDAKDFVFRIQTADVTVAGSQLATGQDVNSGDGNNTVDVAATALAFVAQPANTAVGAGMTAVTVSANDVNGNRDLNFTSSIDITSTGTLAASPITVAAVAGLATFNAITHTLTGAGLTLNAERNGTLDWDVVSNPFNITAVTTYTWNGGNGLWTTATNWTPTRTTPDPSDILQFNDGTPAIVTDVPAQTIGRLLVSNNTAVSLEAPAANTLTIAGGSGTDLDVPLGSQLNSSGALAALTIQLSAGATGSITGNMTFSGAAHKFNAGTAGAVTFISPAVFTQGTGCTGNVFGTTGTADVMVFGTGTTFLQVVGSNPFGLGSPSSKVVFQTGNLFKMTGASPGPSFSGRTYANVEFAGTGTSTMTGASAVSIDNLTITSGTVNINMTANPGHAIKGNISVAPGAALNFAPASLGTLNLSGTAAQSITNNGTFTYGALQSLTINNAAGVTLNSDITLGATTTLTLSAGILTLAAPATTVTLSAGTTLAGTPSNTAYIDGKVKKIGNTDFTFPIGRAPFGYVPIKVSNFAAAPATDEFTAQYLRGNARLLGPVTAPFIDHVSGCDWWTLDRTGSATATDVTAYWSANNTCGGWPYIDDLSKLELVHFDGTNWNSSSIGFHSINGGVGAGDITWSGVTTFSPFSLGSTDVNFNPLPITINYFTGAKQNGNHLLNWKVTCTNTPTATMELERSSDGRNYTSVYSITATSLQCQQPFNHTDAQPAPGVNYYRLKLTDANGKVTYSSIVSLINATKGFDIRSIAPNPIVAGKFNLQVSAAQSATMQLVITDMQGRVLQQQNASLTAGFNVVPVNVRSLAAGTYQVVIYTAEGRAGVQRFVIQ